jgi:hypothetical protein
MSECFGFDKVTLLIHSLEQLLASRNLGYTELSTYIVTPVRRSTLDFCFVLQITCWVRQYVSTSSLDRFYIALLLVASGITAFLGALQSFEGLPRTVLYSM